MAARKQLKGIRHWGPADDASLKAGAVGGRTAAEVAAALGRSPAAVKQRALRIGVSFRDAKSVAGGAAVLRTAALRDVADHGRSPKTIDACRTWMSDVVAGKIRANGTQLSACKDLIKELRFHGMDDDAKRRSGRGSPELQRWMRDEDLRGMLEDFVEGASGRNG